MLENTLREKEVENANVATYNFNSPVLLSSSYFYTLVSPSTTYQQIEAQSKKNFPLAVAKQCIHETALNSFSSILVF